MKMILSLALMISSLSLFAGNNAKVPATPQTPNQKVTPLPVPQTEEANALCFCADNETGLQGCAVGAVKQVGIDPHGRPLNECLDPQTSLRALSQTPSYLNPEPCVLQDTHTGEIRNGNLQCVVTGALRCQ